MSNMRKIAVVIPKYGLVGGAEQFTLELTERIARNPRYDVHVFANQWLVHSARITFHKVPLIIFPRFLTTISFAYFAGRQTAALKFDLIHAHDRIFHADIFTMHCTPHRIWVHDVRKKHMSLFDYGTNWVERRLINNGRCAMLLPVSNMAREMFLKEYNLSPQQIMVMHPGVDIEMFNTFDRQFCRLEVRRHFGIDPLDTVILFVAMNFEIKGLDRLIKAMARLKAINHSAQHKLLVIGKGDVKKYTRMAKKTGIEGNILFAGVLGKEKLVQIYLASDIYVMLSKFDTFGMSVLEAMAASLPVIVSSKVGAKDLVIPGGNGFVVEDEMDADGIAGLIGLLLDSKLNTGMGQKAHQTAIANTWDVVAKKVEAIYEQILSAPRSILSDKRGF